MSNEYTEHYKPQTQLMRPYLVGEDLTGVSVSEPDKSNLNDGGWIAISRDNPDDKWFVAKKFYDDNYRPVDTESDKKVLAEVVKKSQEDIKEGRTQPLSAFKGGLAKRKSELNKIRKNKHE